MSSLSLRLPSLSPIGWLLGGFTIFAIVGLGNPFLNPGPFMKKYAISDEAVSRTMSFSIILVNVYDLIGALRDDVAIYWFSLITRIVATGMFYSFDGAWKNLAMKELGSGVMLGAAMAWCGRY